MGLFWGVGCAPQNAPHKKQHLVENWRKLHFFDNRSARRVPRGCTYCGAPLVRLKLQNSNYIIFRSQLLTPKTYKDTHVWICSLKYVFFSGENVTKNGQISKIRIHDPHYIISPSYVGYIITRGDKHIHKSSTC